MAGFLVRAKLIISGDHGSPINGCESIPGFEKKWNIGDEIRSGRSRKHTDAGFSVILLGETESVDWCGDALPNLKSAIDSLQGLVDICALPTPLISVYVDTDGERFPPLYFSREFLSLVHLLRAELDIDVIETLNNATKEPASHKPTPP